MKCSYNQITKPEYPKIMINRDKDLIVAFSGLTQGAVLYSNTPDWKVGGYSDVWFDHRKSTYWTPFKGTITIEV